MKMVCFLRLVLWQAYRWRMSETFAVPALLELLLVWIRRQTRQREQAASSTKSGVFAVGSSDLPVVTMLAAQNFRAGRVFARPEGIVHYAQMAQWWVWGLVALGPENSGPAGRPEINQH